MWQRLKGWLERLPIDDPVDRRNAFFMQLLMIYEGCEIPLNKLYLLVTNPTYGMLLSGNEPSWPRFALAIDLGTDLVITLSAWLGFYLIRTGRFRGAVAQFLGTLLMSSLIAYSTFGYEAWPHDLVSIVALALGGLMLGRRALWTIYAIVMFVFVAGMTRDQYRHVHAFFPLGNAYGGLVSQALAYLLVVIILDRSTSALRASLAESNLQRRQLQHEMLERERTREQLVHAQKMDAVGRLTSGIAHDFNNVLGIILGFGLERHRLDEPGASRSKDSLALARALEGVEMAARRGASISGKLLNFSRLDVTRVEVFDVAEALRELSPLLRQLLPPSVRLHIDTPPTPLPIRFDRSQFELAVLNIASNARDAMPDGGDFTVTALREGFDSVAISLRDDGQGMPEAVRQRIFEPFFTTKAMGSGTGLGLSVVYGLVDRANGRIDVTSEPGIGTAFHILLDLADDHIAMDADMSSTIRERIRVLLIDDDEDLRNMLALALENGGCEVSVAATGAEAERHVQDCALQPDIVVCDNRMPDTDGVSLLRRLRTYLPRVPVILISAYLDSDAQPPADDLYTERLPKPFAPSHLVSRVLKAAGVGSLPA
ncbi:MAG TPA: ATP-binding protein [Luteibacter sp.]|jgi:signal transduction histidine kinase/CheY-like chemotaxis protein|nr:ATP-binding protein [Luteibacter sp.]